MTLTGQAAINGEFKCYNKTQHNNRFTSQVGGGSNVALLPNQAYNTPHQ